MWVVIVHSSNKGLSQLCIQWENSFRTSFEIKNSWPKIERMQLGDKAYQEKNTISFSIALTINGMATLGLSKNGKLQIQMSAFERSQVFNLPSGVPFEC